VTSLLQDAAAIAGGNQWEFSFAIWAYLTVLAVACAAVLTAATPQLTTPLVVEVLARPWRVAKWTLLAGPCSLIVLVTLAFTGFGAPFAVLLSFLGLGLGCVGTIALATAVMSRAVAQQAFVVKPWVLAVVGMLAVRVIRLVPFVGAWLESLIVVVGYSLAFVVMVDGIRSWHARRMPDEQQFAGERLVEWNTPDEPADDERS
jgi:hypothetical protein